MATDVYRVVNTNPIKDYGIILGMRWTDPTGYFYDDTFVIKDVPAYSDLSGKYNEKFDDVSYY